MVGFGQGLTRFSNETFCIWDVETFGPSLNLAFALPWELSYALFTLKGGIQSIHTDLIRWPNVTFSADNPSAAHFDRARYDREARDPREVYGEFGPLIRKHRSVYHNGLGFDSLIEGNWRRAIGLPVDYSYLYSPGVIDTNCLSKAYRAGWVPNLSSPEAFLAWQYAAYSTRLPKPPKGHAPKTRLGVMCAEFKIEYDVKAAHSAQYDIERNVMLFRELAYKVEF